MKKRTVLYHDHLAGRWRPVQTPFWRCRVSRHQVKSRVVARSTSSSTRFHLSPSGTRQTRGTPASPDAWPAHDRTRCHIPSPICIGLSSCRQAVYSKCDRPICTEVPSLEQSLMRTSSHISSRKETTFCRIVDRQWCSCRTEPVAITVRKPRLTCKNQQEYQFSVHGSNVHASVKLDSKPPPIAEFAAEILSAEHPSKSTDIPMIKWNPISD